ncbi:MAG: DMT family transporter, partial [Polymorphobacter sp.]
MTQAGNAPSVAIGALTPRVIAQFLTVTAIWGSTWIVIRSQLGVVPPAWSVAYRFLIAGTVLLSYCLLRPAMRTQLLSLGIRGHGFTLLVALMQFSLNFNLIYRAQQHLTSGLVSLLFALLIVPNALFGWVLLGQRVTWRFAVGSLIGVTGVALMFARDL